MNISKKLEIWTQEKLISEPQKQAIVEFEMKTKRPMFLYVLLFLSSFCIGLGVLAIIASNWQIIPANAKLFGDFVILASLAGGIYYAQANNKNFLKEAFILLYAVMILASIGLIAQIFQLVPHGYRAYLFWAVMAAPLLYFSKKAVLSFIWLPVFIASLLDFLDDFAWFSRFVRRFDNMFPAALAFLSIVFLVSIYVLIIKKYYKSSALALAFKYWSIILIVAFVISMDIFSIEIFNPYYRSWTGETTHVLSNLLLWGVAGGLLAGYGYYNRRQGAYWAAALLLMSVFSFVVNILPQNRDAYALWGAMLTLSMLGLASVYAYRQNNIKLLNLASVLMAVRFFIIYIQVFGSLLTTGFGLISTGVVFLIIAYIWQKLRADIVTKIKEQN